MLKIVCDKCGTEFAEHKLLGGVCVTDKAFKVIVTDYNETIGLHKFHLCDDCLSSLSKWFAEGEENENV